MHLTHKSTSALIACLVSMACAAPAYAQATGDIYTAVAAVKAASGATAETPMAFTIERKMPQGEVNALLAAFKPGGAAGLRKALAGVAPTGSVRVGAARITVKQGVLVGADYATEAVRLAGVKKVRSQPRQNSADFPYTGTCSSGMGAPASNRTSGRAIRRVIRRARSERALSVEMPVLAYICR